MFETTLIIGRKKRQFLANLHQSTFKNSRWVKNSTSNIKVLLFLKSFKVGLFLLFNNLANLFLAFKNYIFI